MPSFRRGARNVRSDADREVLLLACPRLDPTWELRAVGSLMKPKDGAAGVRHREPEQPWTAEDEAAAREIVPAAAERVSAGCRVAEAAAGDYHFVAELRDAGLPALRGVALVLSRRLPQHWFRLGRLYVHGGRFLRRRRHVELNLVPAAEATVPREVRAALKDLL